MQKKFRTALATAAAVAVTGGMVTISASPASAAGSGLHADFNGDGYTDIAVSASAAAVAGKKGAGQIVVHYGSAKGISATNRALISQNSAGVPGSAETGDYFGAASGFGDFNKDGFADLAVGAFGEDVGSDKDSGTAVILWGSAKGLNGGTTIEDPAPAKHDHFAKSIETADFDGDGKTDIALGSTGSTVDRYRGGFTKSGGTGGHDGISLPVHTGSYNGIRYLTSGDVNGDGVADLIVNAFSTATDFNANYWVRGTRSGNLSGGSAGLLPAGTITAVGKLNSDEYSDIVIGLEWDRTKYSDAAGQPAAKGGKVLVVNGSASGPVRGVSDSFTQNTPGVPGSSEKQDYFGGELGLGDINGDGHLDLAIGAYGETVGPASFAGSVTVLYGTADGLSTAGAQSFTQDSTGVPSTPEKEDSFGSDVSLSDLDRDGKGDLTIGAQGEDDYNGSVTLLRSDGKKITTTGARTLSPGAVGISTAGYPSYGMNFTD
ncbi:FG-GAP and VCBS repeat-containing protein [Streptomyces jumonjinensis]|uniref:FG-GAP and VCBS repeat-containing protein n=1 Tax=Streptomyces jumonjinensis TaxID=1945 RepID=UPI0037AE9CC1